jgi:hypothetical protein
MPSKSTNAALIKLFEIQWQDHFQTRQQTWKALEISALIAVALVGMDWNINNPYVTVGVAILLGTVSLFAIQITIRHRNNVKVKKFEIISQTEKRLGLFDLHTKLPNKLYWWDILALWRSNTSLFIMRMDPPMFSIFSDNLYNYR